LERLERLKEREDELSGIETSIPTLDEIMNGLKKGKLYYVLGRPGMGKSTLGIGMAWHNAHALKGKRVFLWSGEMDVEEVDNLIVSKVTRIPSNHLDTPARLKGMSEANWEKVYGAATALAQSSLIIDDDAGLTVPQLRSKLMRAHMRYGKIDLVVLDHLHLMETTGKAENETVAVSRISQELRILAKDLNVPIVCLAQLSREVERRQDKRPTMADAKQAGKIEEDAYGMVMVYRDDYYNPDTSLDMGLAELLVRKNRGGRMGMTKVRFVEELPAFEPLTGGQVVRL
jgi:replicative DNA helicase